MNKPNSRKEYKEIIKECQKELKELAEQRDKAKTKWNQAETELEYGIGRMNSDSQREVWIRANKCRKEYKRFKVEIEAKSEELEDFVRLYSKEFSLFKKSR